MIQSLAAQSQGIVVMTKIAARLLADVYGVCRAARAGDSARRSGGSFQRDETHKARLGLAERQVICTFGLINRGKGLEYMIEAMPRIVAACPDAIYLIVGATHPQVKRQEGEVYRESLAAMAESLGVGDHVRFVNEFLSLDDLLGIFASLRRVRDSLSRKRPDCQRHFGLCPGGRRCRGQHSLPVRRGSAGRGPRPARAVWR